MSDDGYERPQWMKARLKSVLKLPDCGSVNTHSACRCFIKKIIELEEELVKLRGTQSCHDDMVGMHEAGMSPGNCECPRG